MKSILQFLVAGILLTITTAGFGQQVIITQPQNQTNVVSATATFWVEATGGTSTRDAVKLWHLSAERELLSLPAQGKYFFSIGFSSDGNTLVAMGASGIAQLWRAPSWEEIEAAQKRQEAP